MTHFPVRIKHTPRFFSPLRCNAGNLREGDTVLGPSAHACNHLSICVGLDHKRADVAVSLGMGLD